jgi:ligand-binding sensor domain-containing protein
LLLNLIVVFLQCVSVCTSFANIPPQAIRFQHIGVEQGMSQNSVLACLQDRQGFIWSGTYDGLNRYDGTGFTIFRHAQRDSTSLPKNWVSALYEDKHGTLWVGTNGGGLAKYIPAKRAFITFRADARRKNTLPSNEISALTEDADGNLWVGTVNGLCRYNPQTQDFTTFSELCTDALPGKEILALYTDKEGYFWIGTRTGTAVYDIRAKKCTILNLFTFTQHQNIINSTTISSPRKKSASSFVPPIFSENLVNIVQVFLQDRFGTIWVGTRGALFSLNRNGKIWNQFTGTAFAANPANTRSLASANVQSLFEDKSGTLWIGSKNGLHIYDHAAQVFVRFLHDENNPTTLSDDFVMSILQDKSGVLWFGTSGGGFSKYDVLAHRFPV